MNASWWKQNLNVAMDIFYFLLANIDTDSISQEHVAVCPLLPRQDYHRQNESERKNQKERKRERSEEAWILSVGHTVAARLTS